MQKHTEQIYYWILHSQFLQLLSAGNVPGDSKPGIDKGLTDHLALADVSFFWSTLNTYAP
jgi:hypothetical protein